jgi:hypothetical protein
VYGLKDKGRRMINEYTVKQINKTPALHSKSFVLKDDCIEVLGKFIAAAIEAGVDEGKMMEIINDEEATKV